MGGSSVATPVRGASSASLDAVGRLVVRRLRPGDIEGTVALRRLIWPDEIETPASLAWSLDHPVPTEQKRHWVATDAERVVGFGVAGLASWTTGRVGYLYLGVHPDSRGRGIGGRLFRRADAHVVRLHPARTVTGSERGEAASAGFLERRGFVHTRDDQAWSVDPRTVECGDLETRQAAAEAVGLRLVPIRSLLKRPGDLYRLNLALEHDLPSDVPVAQSYQTWRVHDLADPLFAPDASFCVLAGDDPVAMTWIRLDAAGRRARHGMTGTARPYRHRGLARLVKLASIHWLAQHGVTALYTDNDCENQDMLVLNEHLGFRPLMVFALWRRNEQPAA